MLIDLVDHLGVDSPLWAERYGHGYTHSQLVAMETGKLTSPHGVIHPLHPASKQRAEAARSHAARGRAQHYHEIRQRQERRVREQGQEVSGG